MKASIRWRSSYKGVTGADYPFWSFWFPLRSTSDTQKRGEEDKGKLRKNAPH